MSLKIRRFLYITFIIAFLIITPLVSIYATGYKISIKNILGGDFVIQKIGMLILDSEPRGAIIHINQKPFQLFFKQLFTKEEITTPAKIKNLLPGEYEVKLELAGYWPWQKKLTIHPAVSTYAEDVYLFKNSLPLLLLSGNINNLSVSPNNKYLLLAMGNQRILYDLESEEQIIVPVFKAKAVATTTANITPSSPLWTAKKLIIDGDIIDLNNPSLVINLEKTIGVKITDIKLNNISNDNIYYQYQDSINYFNLITNLNETLINNRPLIDYLIKDNYLFLINQTGKSININTYYINENQLLSSLSLPLSDSYSFTNPGNKFLNLYDQEHQMLYLIDPLLEFNPLRETINNVKYTKWINDKKLLYANDFEIWLFDVNENKKTLLTRISREINNIFWHPSNNYVIFSTDKTINIIELDDREKRNIIELIKLDNIKWLTLSKDGNILYFYAKIGNQEGLYKLAIQ